ncbi:hypothetical protein LK994_00150 [Ferruginibacter lapsinanis]|uniref:hypothetical protein n=1 Tax=Ferruginibacter lapsinanis TaxID=563172 RepID=UPI001E5B6246|nr:hypothetical protein [Ferruginibacter lapsinanis]UEG49885.1 hypothetical protein LK994_00150 [Ferruginibacter lapsinanis]
MNKRILLIFLSSALFTNYTIAQYYYKEILSNKQLISDRNAFKDQKTRTIIIHSLEADGEPSKDFFCEKNINKDFTRIETHSKSNISGESILTTYFTPDGLVLKTTDSSELSASTSTYKYDNNNNLINITSVSHSNDDDFATTLTEEHQYLYNEKNQPVKLLRIKNRKDTTVINFTIDEKGNVSDEIEAIPNGRHYYYYYSENNRLTDIVRYNVIKNKLLPDFIFEYNTAGQLLQMITSEEGPNSDYFIWKYFYGDDGLRIIEKCYSKEKDLLGSFEYEYK